MRPLDPKRPIHLILRSTRARGPWSMLVRRNEVQVKGILDKTSEKYGVRVYRFANVGNHLHILVLVRTRTAFKRFLRELTGRIAATITGSRKSHPMGGKFWDFLPYTRIVSWGRDLKNIEAYFIKNLFEAAGLLTRKAKAAGLRIISINPWAAGPPG